MRIINTSIVYFSVASAVHLPRVLACKHVHGTLGSSSTNIQRTKKYIQLDKTCSILEEKITGSNMVRSELLCPEVS